VRWRWLQGSIVVAVLGLVAVPPARAESGVRPHDVAAPATQQHGAPYPVGIVHVAFTDPTRAVDARGPTPASPSRTLNVTVRYPAVSKPAPAVAELSGAPARRGRRGLVLFAHGLALSDRTYPGFLHDLAAAGFVVADPEFPLSSSALPGPASSGDVVNQAGDLAFVADRILDATTRPSPLRRVRFAEKIAVVGHSDGGVTAAGFAANACCADPRVGAAVTLSGALSRFPGPWFTTAAPPVLVLHGDADEVNPQSGRAHV